MPKNDPAGVDRRSFLRDTLRFFAFGALVATGAVLGLRKDSSGKRVYQCTNRGLLSCRECSRTLRCDVYMTDSIRRSEKNSRLGKRTGREGELRAKK